MELFEIFFKSIDAYPIWMKIFILVAAVISIVALAVALRKSMVKSKNTSLSADKGARIYMKLKAVQLFPDDPSAEIQIIAYVNGIEFIHPSVDDAKWMQVDSEMSEKIFELPTAERYHIRFEMNFRSEKKLEGGPVVTGGAVSSKNNKKATRQIAMPITFPKFPFIDEYKLYLLNDGLRDASVKAKIPYEIYAQ